MVELIVVIVIILVLVPNLLKYINSAKKARCAETRHSLCTELFAEGTLPETDTVIVIPKSMKKYKYPSGGIYTAKYENRIIKITCSVHDSEGSQTGSLQKWDCTDLNGAKAGAANLVTILTSDLVSANDPSKTMLQYFFQSGGYSFADSSRDSTETYQQIKKQLADEYGLDPDSYDFALKTDTRNHIVQLLVSDSLNGKKMEDTINAVQYTVDVKECLL